MLYNGNKLHAYIIEATTDHLKCINDQGIRVTLRQSEIDKKLIPDKRTGTRDSSGNTLQIDDVVKVTNKRSQFYDQKGIIKSICKNCIFLWDKSFMTQSYGIFVENPRHTTI